MEEDDLRDLFTGPLDLPPGLGVAGARAARALANDFRLMGLAPTSRVFYTGPEWAAAGHKLGGTADLVLDLTGSTVDRDDLRHTLSRVLGPLGLAFCTLEDARHLGVYPAQF